MGDAHGVVEGGVVAGEVVADVDVQDVADTDVQDEAMGDARGVKDARVIMALDIPTLNSSTVGPAIVCAIMQLCMPACAIGGQAASLNAMSLT